MKQEAAHSSLVEGAVILLSIWFTAAGRVILSPCLGPTSSRNYCTAWPWRWRQYDPSKCWETPSDTLSNARRLKSRC